MKPRIKLSAAITPDGGEMELYRHDHDFFIRVNGHDLMHSRHHESEKELARLGCAHLAGRHNSRILIGGLGMGYTLRQALDLIEPDAEVTVSELIDAVVDWNREFIGELNHHPLSDQRVDLETGDIVDLVSHSENRFDAILLDIDNGPDAMTCDANHRLYGYQGITACDRALRQQGCLAVWSSSPDREFEKLLMNCGFHVHRFRVPAYRGGKAQSRFIFVAAKDKAVLPPGGSAPRRTRGGKSAKKRRQKQSGRGR